MDSIENSNASALRRAPWNKGKLTGQKPPLRSKHVWLIRTKLQIEQADARSSDVQPGYRQQAARLRRHSSQG